MTVAAELMDLFTGCYVFFKLFCSTNPRNQALLFASLSIISSHLAHIPAVEDTVAAIFQDNVDLCKRVPPLLLEQMLDSAFRSTHTKPLQFCRTILMPNGCPLKRNQNTVMKRLGKHLEDIRTRLQVDSLLRLCNSARSGAENDVSFAIELLNVFAASAFGKSHATESLCQLLVPTNTILTVLSQSTHIALNSALVRCVLVAIHSSKCCIACSYCIAV